MKIIQITPPLDGAQAVYVDPDAPSGFLVRPVHAYALVDFGEFIDMTPMDYVPGEGFVACEADDFFLGVLLPGQDPQEIYGEDEANVRAIVADNDQKASGGNN